MRRPRVLMYHGVGEDDVPVDVFRWQLALLKREFDLTSLDELVERLGRGTTNGHEAAITFDDGVVNHWSVAYPLLREAAAPATFFVCPGLVDSGRWIWNVELRLRMRCLRSEELDRLARESALESSDVEALIVAAKGWPLLVRQAFEERVRGMTTQFEPTPAQIDRFAPMRWEQLERIDPAVVTIGSHTVDHPILTTLSADQKRMQIESSRQRLEARLGRTVDLFCYPNGDNDLEAATFARRGYRAAVTTRAGFIERGADPALLSRIAAGETRSLFVRRLHRPSA